jgi:hypothetical protein
MVVSPVGLGTKNYCAGEGQQQYTSQSVAILIRESKLRGPCLELYVIKGNKSG